MNQDFVYSEIEEDPFISYDHSGVDSGEDDDSLDFEEKDLSLCFIRHIGKESGGVNIYEFIFTSKPNEFWGDGFEYSPAGICNFLEPDSRYIQKIVKVRMLQNLDLVQNNGCFSMQDCMDGAVALAWQSLLHEDSYPEYRLIFKFGESYADVESKLAMCHILMGGL